MRRGLVFGLVLLFGLSLSAWTQGWTFPLNPSTPHHLMGSPLLPQGEKRKYSSHIRMGRRAPEWSVRDWINSEPLTLRSLRGQAVLVRWWTGPGCSFCALSVPRLNRLHRRYGDRGLRVVGFYHHKSNEPLHIMDVRRLAKRLGMNFPIAVDPEWRTLARYRPDRGAGETWTSKSFLIDPEGIVRYIHPGGEITDKDEEILSAKIEAILKLSR